VALKDEGVALWHALRAFEEGLGAVMVAEELRQGRHVDPARPLTPRRRGLELALSEIVKDDLWPEDLGVEKVKGHALSVLKALTILARSLVAEELWGGAMEGSPLLTESDREIHTRLLQEADLPPTLIASAKGSRRGSGKHDRLLHQVQRDLSTFRKATAGLEGELRAGFLQVLEVWDAHLDRTPGSKTAAEIKEYLAKVKMPKHRVSTEILRRFWFAKILEPFFGSARSRASRKR
jgi:hypothetical protein